MVVYAANTGPLRPPAVFAPACPPGAPTHANNDRPPPMPYICTAPPLNCPVCRQCVKPLPRPPSRGAGCTRARQRRQAFNDDVDDG